MFGNDDQLKPPKVRYTLSPIPYTLSPSPTPLSPNPYPLHFPHMQQRPPAN